MIGAWWHGLEPRERRVVGIGAALVVAVLLWSTIWQPLGHERARLVDDIERQRRELAMVRTVAALPTAVTIPDAAVRVDRQGKSLLALVDASARDAGLDQALSRVEPVGANGVRATFAFANFDVLAGWLEMLARDYRVRISELSVDRAEGNGLVSARVTLEDAS